MNKFFQQILYFISLSDLSSKMEPDFEMDQVLQSIRGLFVEDAIANTKKENASLVIDGDLFPIPSLR